MSTLKKAIVSTGQRLRERSVLIVGYGIYVALLSAGYYYNLTFVQLGLIDIGTRRVAMSEGEVSAAMAAFALTAFAAAAVSGWMMDRKGWSSDLRIKLRALFGVVAAQTVLTLMAVRVQSEGVFLAWMGAASLAIGVGIPASFSLMSDFIPVRHRGAIAALVAGLAFFVAALYPIQWRVEEFAPLMGVVMVPAAMGLGVVSFRSTHLVDRLALQHERFGRGRFCYPTPVATSSFTFWGLVILMFAVFFIDSLGFLRIIDAPVYISTSWQSPEVGVRVFIAMTHVLGALIAGVLYTVFEKRWLFLWIFGLFAFTHLLYTFHIATAPSGLEPPLVLPFFYVLAVSFYTTLNFALWPDLSTSDNVGLHTALGVGIAGWLASFLSTSLALRSSEAGHSLLEHLRYVNALALLLAVGYPAFLYLRRMRILLREGES
ncbi:MAG: MFS transporter [Acidimicrobiia bacterium]